MTEGMNNIPSRMQSGDIESSEEPNIFTLTELSLLMKILSRIKLIDVYKTNQEMKEILIQKKKDVLKEAGLREDDIYLSEIDE
ncbi:hypothetical protein Mgra_00004791, partial [Meloidogyne graminicola]